jgi:hypothetical protein
MMAVDVLLVSCFTVVVVVVVEATNTHTFRAVCRKVGRDRPTACVAARRNSTTLRELRAFPFLVWSRVGPASRPSVTSKSCLPRYYFGQWTTTPLAEKAHLSRAWKASSVGTTTLALSSKSNSSSKSEWSVHHGDSVT